MTMAPQSSADYAPEPRATRRAGTTSGALDPTKTGLVQLYYDRLVELFRMFVDEVYPPVARSRRVPIGHVILTPEQEWRVLNEAKRRAELADAGYIEHDSETRLWMANADGAQQRYEELRAQFEAVQ